MKSKRITREKNNIKKFIQCINEKNYAAADKYLEATVQSKMAAYMMQAKQKSIFKQ
jgi:hypothetical protein